MVADSASDMGQIMFYLLSVYWTESYLNFNKIILFFKKKMNTNPSCPVHFRNLYFIFTLLCGALFKLILILR